MKTIVSLLIAFPLLAAQAEPPATPPDLLTNKFVAPGWEGWGWGKWEMQCVTDIYIDGIFCYDLRVLKKL